LFISDSITATMNPLVKRYRKNQPSKWAIFGIISGIILFAIGFVVICVLIRVYRPSGKRKTTDS
jgi:t-SNARE complex subunit (syntaxin)